MPKTKYTPEQITIAMALTQSGFSDTSAARYSGVNRNTVLAARLGKFKKGASGDRYDIEIARRIAKVLKAGKIESLRAMAETLRAAAAVIETEIQ